MRKTMKKVIATVCATAMVVSSVTFYNNTLSMADEQSTETTTQNPSTNAASSTDLQNSAFLIGDAGAGQFKAMCGNGLINRIVNIQKDTGAAEYGIYVAFKDANFGEMTVNGVELNAFVNGAGITMYLSNFIYKYSDVVIKNSDGTPKAVLYVYNSQGIDNSASAIIPETTTVDTSAEIPLTRLPATSTHQEFGSYKVSANVNAEAYAGIDPTNRDHLQIHNASGPSNNSFSVSRAFTGLTAGVKYVLSLDITPSVVNGSYKTLKDLNYIPLQAGTTTVSMVSTAYNNGSGVIQADFTLYVNMLGADVILDISNPQYREYIEGEVVTNAPPETTTASQVETTTASQVETTTASQVETTTVAQVETTTANNAETTVAGGTDETTSNNTSNNDTTTKPATTTVAPTTKPSPTTVAPTTKAPAVKTPAKAKIKKVTPKKKASKVLKITIKKVNGAKGYQVQISKAKKFTSKNILAKKNVTKVKPSISSKKIKNQKKLYVRVRAYVLNANGKKVYGKWSSAKRATIK